MAAIQKKRYGIKDMQEVHPIPHLDLPDLHEIACLRPKDGAPYLMFLCEEAKPYVGTCPTCGAASVQKHGTLKKDRFIHDVSRGNFCVDILLKCRRYQCNACNTSFVHPYESIVEKSQLTKRLLTTIRAESFENTFQSVATRYGYSVPAIISIFEKYAKELEEARGPIVAPRVLGIDEKHIVNAARGVFVDVETGRFLEMTPDNKGNTVEKTIKNMVGYKKNIEIVTMDMSCGYRAHIEKIFGDSGVSKVKIIVDKFHVMQDLSRKVASTKTKLMAYRSDIIKHLSNEERWFPENDEMVYVYGALANDPWLFRFGYQKLSNDPDRKKRMAVISERLPEFNHLRLLKEGLERVYYEATDRAEAKKLLDEWYTLVPPVRNARSIEEWEKKYGVDAELFADFRSLQKTLISWENEILNYFEPNCQFTNAVSEGTNSAIQKINERGSGYEFKHLRAKALFGHVAIPRVRYDKKNLVSQISVSSYSPGNVGFWTFDTDFMKQKPIIIGIDFYSKPYENTLQPLSALDDSLLDVIF